MAMEIEQKLESLGHTLPAAPPLAGNYLPYMRIGNLLFLSGTLAMKDDEMSHTGQVGDIRTVEYGMQAAQVCALNALANIKAALGSLDKIKQMVSVSGFVNAVSGFSESPAVLNGASDFFVEVLGDRGRHTRAAVAVAGLPKNSTVEIQCIVEA